jgi:hypothetical protein
LVQVASHEAAEQQHRQRASLQKPNGSTGIVIGDASVANKDNLQIIVELCEERDDNLWAIEFVED